MFIEQIYRKRFGKAEPDRVISIEGRAKKIAEKPLRLEFQVSRIAGAACTPLSSAMVDVWHCDAAGVYSDVRDGQKANESRSARWQLWKILPAPLQRSKSVNAGNAPRLWAR